MSALHELGEETEQVEQWGGRGTSRLSAEHKPQEGPGSQDPEILT